MNGWSDPLTIVAYDGFLCLPSQVSREDSMDDQHKDIPDIGDAPTTDSNRSTRFSTSSLSCPYCGAENVVVESEDSGFWWVCEDCEAGGLGFPNRSALHRAVRTGTTRS